LFFYFFKDLFILGRERAQGQEEGEREKFQQTPC